MCGDSGVNRGLGLLGSILVVFGLIDFAASYVLLNIEGLWAVFRAELKFFTRLRFGCVLRVFTNHLTPANHIAS